MLRYILTRLGQSLLTVYLTISAVFVLIRMAPGDPAYAMAGPLASQADLDAVRHTMGLDQPLSAQYLLFLRHVVVGNLGQSYSYHQDAFSVVLSVLPNTVLLAVAAMLVATIVSIPLGVWMARRSDTPRELSVNVLTIAGQSMPDFWIGIMLLTLFAVVVPIFPAAGFTSWSGLALPAATVAILQIALISRMVRGEMQRNLAAPYMTVARSRGLASHTLTWGYALRNSSIPVLTTIGTRFASMLNGVVVVEVVFAWPGIGSLIVRALDTRDYPLIEATVLVTSIFAVVVQLLIDLCYPLLDPRVRVGRRASL